MKWGFLAIAVFAGVLNPVLAGINSSLNRSLAQPIWAVAAVFALALSATIVVALATGQAPPVASSVARAPWWSWTGGLFAAGYVLAMTLSADRIGAAVFTGITVTTGIATSILLDHFGWVGFAVHPASLARVVGALVMTVGLALILRF